MRLALIFDKFRKDTVGIYFERAARQLGIEIGHWWLRDLEDIPAKYDLYLRIDHGDDYEVRLPPALRPVMFYVVDTHLPHSWKKIRRCAGWYDMVLCAHRDAASRLHESAWVPLGCDVDYHGAKVSRLRWDIGFVGTDGGVPRKFYLQALREAYPSHYIGYAAPSNLGLIYSSCRIGFNYSIRNDVNMRIFEALCSGTLLVTNKIDNNDLAELGLHDRKHLALYGSPKELFDMIAYFLHNDKERAEIARRGNLLVMKYHTYKHRLVQIVKLAAERFGIGKHLIQDKETLCASW